MARCGARSLRCCSSGGCSGAGARRPIRDVRPTRLQRGEAHAGRGHRRRCFAVGAAHARVTFDRARRGDAAGDAAPSRPTA